MGRLRFGTVGFFVLLGVLALAGVVLAAHLAGRTYTGTITGGGTVTFTVNSAGTAVSSFRADSDGTGTTCAARTVSTMTLATTGNHAFLGSSTVTPTLSVAGSFPTSGTASGTLNTAGHATATCNRAAGTAWSATVAATPTPSPTATPTSTATPVPTRTPVPGSQLPKSGSPAGVIALSGLSLLEAGWGLKLLSRRLRTPLYMVPAHMLRKLLSARRHGQDEVKLTDDWYLVWRKDEDR